MILRRKKTISLEDHREAGRLLRRQDEELQQLSEKFKPAAKAGNPLGPHVKRALQLMTEANLYARCYLENVLMEDYPGREKDLHQTYFTPTVDTSLRMPSAPQWRVGD